MEIIIFSNTYRISPANIQFLLTSNLAALFMANERRIHELLYNFNPIIVYSKSIDFVAFDNVNDALDVISGIENNDKVKLV